MKRWWIGVSLCILVLASLGVLRMPTATSADDEDRGWPQWGQNPQHTGSIDAEGQPITRVLADVLYDPFVPLEQHDNDGELLAHYQAPLTDGNAVYMEFKAGRYVVCDDLGNPIPPDTVCGSDAWNSQIWQERRLDWVNGQLVPRWTFPSDWKPEPDQGALGGWEPVFHAALANGHVYVPGAGGTIFKVNKGNGLMVARINPFGATIDPNTFVAGPLTADRSGNIYYNVLKLNPANAWFPPTGNVVGSWLVKVAPNGSSSMVSYATLIPGAPATCFGAFGNGTLPWPPSPAAVPSTAPCGTQRPGVNIAPAIAPDGTIYTASRAHFNSRYSYVIALNPNLTLKWASSMRDRINDGCGVLVPIAAGPTPERGKCRYNANLGVDPSTNQRPAGRILDAGSSSPVVLPDGNVLFGAYTRYNIARGHLYKFRGSDGAFQAAFDFGWDITPSVLTRSDTDDDGSPRYSIVIKDNHYDEEAGYYCNPSGPPGSIPRVVCASTGIPAGPFYITQLDKNLVPEWKFQDIETRSCRRNPDGSVTCPPPDGQHPNGFEYCINAPAIDGNGVVYINSEDGNLYTIPQGNSGVFNINTPGSGVRRLFLNLAIGAAYTPLSIARDGKIYTENDGHLFVIGDRDN